MQPMKPTVEDAPMEEEEGERNHEPKGKQPEPMSIQPLKAPTPSPSRPAVIPQRVFEKPKGRSYLPQKPSVHFKVKDNHTFKPTMEPEFKYETELQHQMDAEQVYQQLLSQPVTLTLGDVLGLLFDLSKWFLAANWSHRFLTQKGATSSTKYKEEPQEYRAECGKARDVISNEEENA